MPITEADIQKIAALAHLEITEGELHTLAPQVASIVAYVEQLNELDTSAAEPAIGGLTPEGERTEGAREDSTRPSLRQALAPAQGARPRARPLPRAQSHRGLRREGKLLDAFRPRSLSFETNL